MEKKEMLICSECGAKILKKDLEYAEKHDGRFPEDDEHNTIHMDDCGCRGSIEDLVDACLCKFESVKGSYKGKI